MKTTIASDSVANPDSIDHASNLQQAWLSQLDGRAFLKTTHFSSSFGPVHRLLRAAFALLLSIVATLPAQADQFEDFTYTDNGVSITITKYPVGAAGGGGVVVIPNTIASKPVTSIGDGAFSSSGLTSVTIPSSVTSIGNEAFAGSGGLTSVTIPSSVISIGHSAFNQCGLESITIPNSVTTLGYQMFKDCYNLTSVTLSDSLTSIGSGAFSSCRSLGSVMIPNSVTSIGDQAFSGSGLTSVTIPSSVTTIENHAFYGCTGLTSVTIGNSVTSIGGGAFESSGLARITIPANVTSIGDRAFFGCLLTRVIIPASVVSIGEMAFAGSSGMKTVCFQGAAPSMGRYALGLSNGEYETIVYYVNNNAGFTTPVWHIYWPIYDYADYPAFPGVAPQYSGTAPPVTGIVGQIYTHTCTATGTPSPDFVVTSGALPPGLFLSLSGEISGTPAASGIFTGTITVSTGIPPDVTQDFTINVSEYHTLVAGGSNGTVTGGGSYLLNTTIALAATPNPGYLFTGWTGNASGTDNPLAVVMDADRTIGANFTPDTNDGDDDGLTNYQEIVELGTNPTLQDTDGDNVKDKDDAFPLNIAEWLDTDGDGTGDNADTDDDGDGYSDEDEINIHGTNPKRADTDGDGLSDPQEIQTHQTNPNLADTDSDGLSDGAEVNTHGTLPKVGDTDGDGFLDGYEVLTGKSPINDQDKPALVAEARTAIEFTFPSALGKTYRIEDSLDLATWTTVESGIAGNGEVIQRFYSTRNIPKRYFRVEEDGP